MQTKKATAGGAAQGRAPGAPQLPRAAPGAGQKGAPPTRRAADAAPPAGVSKLQRGAVPPAPARPAAPPRPGVAATLQRTAAVRQPPRPAHGVIQAMFIIGNKKVASPFEALGLIKPLLLNAGLKAKPSDKLLQTILMALPAKRDFSAERVIAMYKYIESELLSQIEADREATEQCLTLFKSTENKIRLKRIQEFAPGGKAPTGFSVIFRGMTPGQALRVYNNKTFGGVALNAQVRQPPSEQQAQIQTGYGEKGTTQGVLEEWSLKPGGLKGFSTDGFMMIAIVNNSFARLPPVLIGEAGVTGWQDQGLVEVAIFEPGPQMKTSLDMMFQAKVDGLVRAIAKKLYSIDKVIEAVTPVTATAVNTYGPEYHQQPPPPPTPTLSGSTHRSYNPYGPAYYKK